MAVALAPAEAPAESPLVLVFLTSDCVECRALWEGMSVGPGGPGVVLVTPDPSTQSRRALQEVAPPGPLVVMSSQAWHDYGVTGAPWWVTVRNGTVERSGPAGSDWAALLAEARGG